MYLQVSYTIFLIARKILETFFKNENENENENEKIKKIILLFSIL